MFGPKIRQEKFSKIWMLMMNDETFIRRTFALAQKGLGTTWPNPLVGAVIVKDGKVISEGFHSKKGEPHAELEAIQNAKESLRGSTIYVNLEPCCHTNKTTPPCAQRLIQEGFSKVVICNLDPNPEVNGKGVELLRAAGIEVEFGILEAEGEKINEVFFLSQRKKRPFIHFKTASTLDGKIAMPNGESQWITGEKAREHVHYLRSIQQAIIIGAETLRKDNPKLTVRLPGFTGVQPKRIVFTKSGDLPATHHLFTDEYKANTIVYSFENLKFDFPFVKISSLKDAMDDLFSKSILSIMLESGSTLFSEFLREGFIDRVSIYQNPSFIGAGKSFIENLNLQRLADRPRLTDMESSWIGEDLYLTGRFKG
jgi:diaminohydroxyphosphoribosylaminopyrimidine deaminase/5-amino-6-(5-phosphoribosylamino)uracil reductase